MRARLYRMSLVRAANLVAFGVSRTGGADAFFLGSITPPPLSHLCWLALHCSIAHFTQRLSL